METWANELSSPNNAIKYAFEWAFGADPFFDNIYIPVKRATVNGQPEDFEYVRIGYSTGDIANCYTELYGQNYLSVQYQPEYPDTTTQLLSNKIEQVIVLNKSKYLKMIELLGYAYNPLWNVDGVEDYTYIENSGTNDIETSHQYTTHTDDVTTNIGSHTDDVTTNIGTHTDNGSTTIGSHTDTTDSTNVKTGSEAHNVTENHEDTNSVTSFDSTDFANTEHNIGNKTITNDNTTYNSVTDDGDITVTHSTRTDTNSNTYGARTDTNSTTYGDRLDTNSTTYGGHTDTDTTTIKHHNADNNGTEYSGGLDNFGNTVVGGDKYHHERKVRHGNIGVTKTQELIDSERKNLRWSLLQEFFNDINEQILVGIFD